MKCKTVRSRLDELYRLSKDNRDDPAWVHLASCADCTREFERWMRIADTLKNAPRVDLPDAFAQKVMIAYEERQRRAPWFGQMPFRLPQAAWAMLFLIIAGGSIWLVLHSQRQGQESHATLYSATSPNVRFELAAGEASSVALVGDFNGWDKKACLLTREKTGVWSVELPIAAGSHHYLFLVDNFIWRLDPSNTRSSPDGFGGMNSEISL
jgi:hypothetical protein